MEQVEDNGILYLDAYIALHNAIRCVEHLMDTQSGEVSSLLAHLRTDLVLYKGEIGSHLGDDAEGDLFAQRVEVNASGELPAYLPHDPRMVVYQTIGGYLLQAIGLLRLLPEDVMVQDMRHTLSSLQQIHDAFPEGEIEGGRRKGIRHGKKRIRHTRRIRHSRRSRRSRR